MVPRNADIPMTVEDKSHWKDDNDLDSFEGGGGGFDSNHSSDGTGSHQDSSNTGGATTTTTSSDDPIEGARGVTAISCSRWLFLFILMTAAAVLGGVIYLILRNEEVNDFESQYTVVGEEFIILSGYTVAKDFELLSGLSNAATSFIKEEGHPLGYLTMPDVEDHMAPIRASVGALVIAYAPKVAFQDDQAWIEYAKENQEWITASNGVVAGTNFQPISDSIWDVSGSAVLTPIWTHSPPPLLNDTSVVNRDLLSIPSYKTGKDFMSRTRKPTFLDVQDHASIFNHNQYGGIPQAAIAYPVMDSFENMAEIKGHLIAAIPWTFFFEGILIEGSEAIHVVLSNSCNQTMTFEISGREATFLGEGDLHQPEFDYLEISGSFAGFANAKELLIDDDPSEHCVYSQFVYPTKAFATSYETNQPLTMGLAVVGVFVFTALAFLLFDILVTRRQERLLRSAKQHNAIVASLFPKNVRKKLMEEVQETKAGKTKLSTFGKQGLRSYLNSDNTTEEDIVTDRPIADLFPDTTIMFADISGFTSWSSTREPAQVFTLLETIYREFDRLAKRRKVFKVETVGDCYVAVVGVPDQREDHAVLCTKFAEDCLNNMQTKTKELETILGPDTAELGLRIGLHSGPVVAGVLRGEKSRFQLFGDSMNTASRMESTGVPNRIQASQQTVDLLKAAGKGHWVTKREDLVEAKGKGDLQTYFVSVNRDAKSSESGLTDQSSHTRDSCDLDMDVVVLNVEKRNRAAEWMVELLAGMLKEMSVQRRFTQAKKDKPYVLEQLETTNRLHSETTVLDEVAEVITMGNTKIHVDSDAVKKEELDQKVFDELHDFVWTIASLYNENPFHNFEHAVHVSQSVSKLLNRIVAPDLDEVGSKSLHDHTYGITSDPLTRFSVVVAALIHDLDHPGVPNAVLVKEGAPVSQLYKGKSVAEQNSVDMAWDLLMEQQYTHLRRSIYTNQSEYNRFRQLIVNTVMATDIVDKDLKKLRNDRWATAFSKSSSADGGASLESVNRKATIIIEHLIQASDVAHTMQHFMVYKKWNERFFRECMQAYEQGRCIGDKSPAEDWYKGEIGFFDFYIIPLAKKLKDCGVFGVSSDEYLSYAQQNRMEWELRGESVVEEMLDRYNESKKRKDKRIAKEA